MHPIQEIVKRNKAGRRVGVYSCCSANADVVKAVLLKAKKTKTICLIESTSNQVNQEGGYTGMTAADFAAFVREHAARVGIPFDRVILGGDHLGPLPWAHEAEDIAMFKAAELVRSCVLAGYSKIHLDTSMRVGDDNPHVPLDVAVCADRGARLCVAAEEAFRVYQQENPAADKPVYVLGSEVPIPGGDFDAPKIGVTAPEDCIGSVAEYRLAFEKYGIQDVFSRVVGFVVELGVEFHERTLDEYDATKAASLTAAMRGLPIAIEGHSTDYQTTENLSQMCADGTAILKVGPSFTFAMREALFALEGIESRIYANEPKKCSRFRDVLEEAMLADDSHWRDYYTGGENDLLISRSYSFYDRARYYMPLSQVKAARDTLLKNLSDGVIPLCMLSQYLPTQYFRVRSGEIVNDAEAILLDRIGDRIDCYLTATKNNGEM